MKNYWIVLYFLCVFSCIPTVVTAQDVIIKKDGNTVVCLIVKTDKSQVFYKQWTEMNGNDYVINIADISAIYYRNGEKKFFNDSEKSVRYQFNKSQGYVDDASLLQIANAQAQKARKGRNTGICLIATGAIGLIASGILSENTNQTGVIQGLGFGGIALIVSGSIWWYSSNQKSKHFMLDTSQFDIHSSPILQKEYRFKNGSTLSTNLSSINVRGSQVPIAGLGLLYNF